eukprot:Skav208015  [mRNA]  locus=scaffold320:166663:168051:- [translate_table: standard]
MGRLREEQEARTKALEQREGEIDEEELRRMKRIIERETEAERNLQIKKALADQEEKRRQQQEQARQTSEKKAARAQEQREKLEKELLEMKETQRTREDDLQKLRQKQDDLQKRANITQEDLDARKQENASLMEAHVALQARNETLQHLNRKVQQTLKSDVWQLWQDVAYPLATAAGVGFALRLSIPKFIRVFNHTRVDLRQVAGVAREKADNVRRKIVSAPGIQRLQGACSSMMLNFDTFCIHVRQKVLNTEEQFQSAVRDAKAQKEMNSRLKTENYSVKEENSALKEENSALKEENSALKEENAVVKEERDSLVQENLAVGCSQAEPGAELVLQQPFWKGRRSRNIDKVVTLSEIELLGLSRKLNGDILAAKGQTVLVESEFLKWNRVPCRITGIRVHIDVEVI